MKVLVGCEFSGIVREAFRARGHDAWSCDLEDTEIPGCHLQGDLWEAVKYKKWDLMIAHPPCTYLANSGARWWKYHQQKQMDAVNFVIWLMNRTGIPRICIENPHGILSSLWCKPNQVIHPWEFGHAETKATCLWLRGLPTLRATHIVTPEKARVHRMPASAQRSKKRSRTYLGIAKAMAEQWG